MDQLDGSSEVVFVDDGSKDKSYGMIPDVCRSDARFRTIQLSRNFGHQIAITAGLDLASGDAVIVMDADLQDPPEVVLEMAARWREGYDVVYAVRTSARANPRSSGAASWFYRVLAKPRRRRHAGRRRRLPARRPQALDAFRQMRETNRYVRGMFGWVGFRQSRSSTRGRRASPAPRSTRSAR